MRIAISIGHHPDAPGFTAAPFSEYGEMSAVAGLLVQELQMRGHKAYLIGTGQLGAKVAAVNALAPDIALELHLNAGGGDGVETLYCPGSATGKRLAQAVNGGIVAATGERDRGAKEGWYQGGSAPGTKKDYFLEATACPAVITEAYFLDNTEDRASFADNLAYYNRLAGGIAAGLYKYWSGK